jgi:hypothetical protein
METHFATLGIHPRSLAERRRDYWRLAPRLQEERDRRARSQEELDRRETALQALHDSLYSDGAGPAPPHLESSFVSSYDPAERIPGILQLDEYSARVADADLRATIDSPVSGSRWAEKVPARHKFTLEKSSRLQLAHAQFIATRYGRASRGVLADEVRSALRQVRLVYEKRYPAEVVRRIEAEDDNIDFTRNAFWVYSEPATHQVRYVAKVYNAGPDLLVPVQPRGRKRQGTLLPLERANDIQVPERAALGPGNEMMAKVIEMGRLFSDSRVLGDMSLAMGRIADHLGSPDVVIYAECFPDVAEYILDKFGGDGWHYATGLKQPTQTKVIRITGADFIAAYQKNGTARGATLLPRKPGEATTADENPTPLTPRDHARIFDAGTLGVLIADLGLEGFKRERGEAAWLEQVDAAHAKLAQNIDRAEALVREGKATPRDLAAGLESLEFRAKRIEARQIKASGKRRRLGQKARKQLERIAELLRRLRTLRLSDPATTN